MIETEELIQSQTLKLAITYNQLEVTKVLFASQKLYITSRDFGLEEAAYQGRLDIMDFMIDSHVDIDGTRDTSPLIAAAAVGYVDAVKKLILKGANLEASRKIRRLNQPKQTSLMAAVVYNHVSVTEVLLDSGATLDDYSESKNAPMNIAMRERLPGMVLCFFGMEPN